MRGYSYGEDVLSNPNLNIRYHHNDDLNVKMLLSGRISAILGDTAPTLSAVNNSPQGQRIHYDLNSPISLLDVSYLCHNDPAGIDLCKRISVAIQR